MNSKKNNYKQSALRQSNIELLRIIAMILIIAHHYSFHGGFSFPPEPINLNRLWIQFILIGGKVGVDLFVLISGYFLVSQSSIKADKILKLWFQIFFYSITIFIIFTILGLRSFSIKEFVKHLAPVTFEQWWFASTYFVLYLLVPYINKLLRSFSQKQYVHFLAVILVLWSVIPTFTRHTFQSNSLLWP